MPVMNESDSSSPPTSAPKRLDPSARDLSAHALKERMKTRPEKKTGEEDGRGEEGARGEGLREAAELVEPVAWHEREPEHGQPETGSGPPGREPRPAGGHQVRRQDHHEDRREHDRVHGPGHAE